MNFLPNFVNYSTEQNEYILSINLTDPHNTFIPFLQITLPPQMNRYQPPLTSPRQLSPSSSSASSQRFSSQQKSLYHIQNQQQHDDLLLPSVKKFLSQPNPLMNKIEFTPYHPKCYYPRPLNKLPRCLRDFDCIMSEKNNMNLLHQAMHTHELLKKNALNAIVSKPKRQHQDLSHLVTLNDFYSHKEPIYERYSLPEMKLQDGKVKLKYFATFVLDMAKALRKQMKIQQKQHHINTQANQQPFSIIEVAKTRPASVVKSGNFHIRQHRNSVMQKYAVTNCRDPSQIQFDSNFESGNLFRVYQKQFNQYDLILQNDINTKGNTQWFFFSVKNVSKNTTLKFNLVNMSKSESLFNFGMKPMVFSMMRHQKRKVGWLREGQKVSYQQSQNHKKQSSKNPYHVLSFQYKFLYDGDIVYFSHSIPYTLTDLSTFLNSRLKDKHLQKLIRLKNVGLTLGSNEVDLLEITNNDFVNKAKKSVWIIARQHPGETTSGFMTEGIIDFLISENQTAKNLLNNFVFKLVLMVNVDGVIHGNSRAQFIGLDPNRRWSTPHKLHNPILYSIKHYIQREKDNVQMFLDLHSHSRKLGTFFYGNTLSTNTAATRIFPLMVCKLDERYTFRNCRFSGGSNNAARYALFDSLKIPLIYTVENSFYGYQTGDFRIVQYFPQDFKEMGASLMKGFFDYQVKKNGKHLKLTNYQNVYSLSLEKDIEAEVDDQEFDKQSVGSDADPGEDEYSQKEFKKLITSKDQKKKKPKKKKALPSKTKPIKQEQPPKLPKKPKDNTSQSHYKQYFSGRLSTVKRINKISDTIILNLVQTKKQTFSFGIQVNLKEPSVINRRDSGVQMLTSNGFAAGNILTQRSNQQQDKLLYAKLCEYSGGKQSIIGPNNLCVIGQKVEEISVYGNCVGIQVSENKDIFMSRFDQQNNGWLSTVGRKSFSVRQRVNSFLQVKQNNFLQRGDCMTKNFFSRR